MYSDLERIGIHLSGLNRGAQGRGACSSACLPACLPVCLSVYLFVGLSVSLSVYKSWSNFLRASVYLLSSHNHNTHHEHAYIHVSDGIHYTSLYHLAHDVRLGSQSNDQSLRVRMLPWTVTEVPMCVAARYWRGPASNSTETCQLS
jgi:hypothetical protein